MKLVKDWFDDGGWFLLLMVVTLVLGIWILTGCYELRTVWRSCDMAHASNYYLDEISKDQYIVRSICREDEYELR